MGKKVILIRNLSISYFLMKQEAYFYNKTVSRTFIIFLFFSFFVPFSAKATNGFIPHGYGAKSKAMAGTGSALPLDGMDSASNPATMVFLGNRLDVGLSLFMPEREFSASSGAALPPQSLRPGYFESRNDIFLIPSFSCNWQLGSDASIAVSIGAHGGMNTEYDGAIFSSFNNPGNTATSYTGIDLKQIFMGMTYSRIISSRHSFGITPILAAQSIRVSGLEPFKPFSVSPSHVTNNGADYSYGGGFRLGWLTRFTDTFSVGLSWQSKLWMTKFDDYQGLFAEQGGFDVPSNVVAGVAWKLRPDLTFVADVQRVFFEEVASISNTGDMIFSPGTIKLGTDSGLGFGWQDITIGKIGFQWDWRPDLSLRMGYSRCNQVIPDSQTLFNVLSPAVVKEHFTMGLTKNIGEVEINFSFMYAPEEMISGVNPNTGTQVIGLEMGQFEMEMSLGFRF